VIQTLALKPSDRLLVLAPHPDDESVATGGLLQHALAVGSRVLVVFFTDGDNNPWAQRASELRWRITAADRARFAVRRRGEAFRALERLGVSLESTRFLRFPDQGATNLLLKGDEGALDALTGMLREWQPTVVVGPSLLDLHPDHSALAVMLSAALENVPNTPAPRNHVRFMVHNPKLLAHHEGSVVLPLSAAQRSRKRAAIACHRTQLVLRSTWLLSFARREERFYLAESPRGLAHHPIRRIIRDGSHLELVLASRTLLRSFGARTVCLVEASSSTGVRFSIELPSRGGTTLVRDLRANAAVGEGVFDGELGRGHLRIPSTLIPESCRLFAKVERAFGFFDEAGWKEWPPASLEGGVGP
jgi:LmbE family N-acetylglucosaminyl deacetylase